MNHLSIRELQKQGPLEVRYRASERAKMIGAVLLFWSFFMLQMIAGPRARRGGWLEVAWRGMQLFFFVVPPLALYERTLVLRLDLETITETRLFGLSRVRYPLSELVELRRWGKGVRLIVGPKRRKIVVQGGAVNLERLLAVADAVESTSSE